uniref:Sjoegren syndrome nuclear autoantigen 1 n=1 Tax=Macaca fascicularis TaxID=9541 RepID=A0A7N9D8P6_MACFA
AAQPGRGGREGRRAGFPARSGVPWTRLVAGIAQLSRALRAGAGCPWPRALVGSQAPRRVLGVVPDSGFLGWKEARPPPPRSALGPAPPSRPPGIEELCQKREELCRQIQEEEDEKQRLQNEVRQLTEKLARVNENLARKIASRNEFDRTIAETEAAYLKILESSQTLLSVLRRNLTKATASDQKSSGGRDS